MTTIDELTMVAMVMASVLVEFYPMAVSKAAIKLSTPERKVVVSFLMTNWNRTYLFLLHFHEDLVYPSTQERQ